MKIRNLKFLNFIIAVILFAFFSSSIFASETKKRFVDDANLLTSSESESLSSKLDEISERQNCDVVIVTEKSIGDKTPEAYADDYFDYNNYGMGKSHDGLLLLVNMEKRDFHISTYGYAITAFKDAGIKHIYEKLTPYLKSKDYSEAFNTFANLCDEFITQSKNSKPYDNKTLPKGEFNNVFWIPISILIGIGIALIVTGIMRQQLKTVAKKANANDYVRKSSVNIRKSRDIFLYSNITRTARPKSSSGSSTHTSSSGRTHGGGGGKF